MSAIVNKVSFHLSEVFPKCFAPVDFFSICISAQPDHVNAILSFELKSRLTFIDSQVKIFAWEENPAGRGRERDDDW